MNKELIKKYKAEFDHSLYGGKLQVKFVNDHWEEAPKDIFSYSMVNFILVIDDEYIEYRKALAEGKTVQYRNLNINAFKNWQNLENLKFNPNFEHRIKPEEPKFKVGDWVVNKTSKQRIIKKVTSVYSDTATVGDSTSGINVMLIKDLELWQPKPGEWCWFYQNKREIPTLGNLKYFSDKNSFCAYSTPKASMSVKYFKHCEPFLGQLPTSLQDIK